MPDPINERVIKATWNWRAARQDDPAAGLEGLRRQAITQFVVMVLIAAFLYFVIGHTFFVPIILALAAIVLVLGMAFPKAYRPVHRFGQWLGRGVGQGLTYLLLVPFFYLFFTPVAFILRLQGRDPMHRSFREPQWTYWIRRAPKERDENIERQFLREDRDARGELRPVDGAAPTQEGDSS